MRSNQNLAGSSNGRVAGKLGVSGMPLEWLDAGSWRLPSGQALAEFALQAGFLAPLLFRAGSSEADGARIGTSGDEAVGSGKDFGRGGSR
ncbi:MAG: hypothetical protein LAP38_21870 [Acidobacteriia bacterium]|nr:hypothetical protein [Terriglobia bacterium]